MPPVPPVPSSARMWHSDAARARWAPAAPELTLTGILWGKGKGLESNKIPLSSCSEDTVWTNSPRKARSCNLLLWEAPGTAAREARAGGTSHPTEGVPGNVWGTWGACHAAWGECQPRQKALAATVSLAPGLHTSLDTSPLSYRCCAAFRIEPLTIQMFEHMCIFHSTNRKNKAAGLQGLDPRARMREAGEVFLWEISVVPPVVSLFPILFADCSALRPWGR